MLLCSLLDALQKRIALEFDEPKAKKEQLKAIQEAMGVKQLYDKVTMSRSALERNPNMDISEVISAVKDYCDKSVSK